MADLHTRITAEIERREEAARDAESFCPSPWRRDGDRVIDSSGHVVVTTYTGVVDHVAPADPADALRRYAHYRRILERHEQVDPWRSFCSYCHEGVLWPCEDVRDIAEALNVELEDA